MGIPNRTSAKVWLALLKEGGRVTAVEAEEMPAAADLSNIRSNLNAMVESGSLRKYSKDEGCKVVKFGVTSDCKVPLGVTVGQVLEALAEAGVAVKEPAECSPTP